jgi:hypothetical protein
MKMKFAIIPFIFIAMALFIASAVVNTISSTIFAQKLHDVHFIAELSGKSTVPTNLSTNATGNAIFTVTEGGNEMSYTVNAMRINHVTDVVLVFSTGGHASNVALLRLGSQHGATGPINGLLVSGNMTSSNLIGPLKGKNILDLAKDMLDGNIYLRVSTIKFPLGMIGKINPAE